MRLDAKTIEQVTDSIQGRLPEYILNPEVQCLGNKLKDYYVLNPEDMMHAFEDIASKAGRPELFIDRHIAAFLSVKDRRMIDPFFAELNAEEY